MRIICERGEFELLPNFKVQYNWNNVVLLDAGEQTQPIVLPGTDHNLRLIEHSDRIDNIYKPITDLEVFIIDGALHRSCNMGIHSADDEDGISCTLYFDSGGFYSRLRNTRMQWLSWETVRHPNFDNVNHETRVRFLIDLLKSEYNSPTANADFCFAPVMTTQELTWRVGEGENDVITERFCLNDFERFQHQYVPEPPNYNVILNAWFGEFRQRQIVSRRVDNIDIGYGMTAFLKLRYILDFIFTRFGYTFDHQQLSSELTGYNNICVLNNVADAIYAGVLNYRQLVPDTTIKQFLDVTQTMLAGVFVFDETRRVARFYFFKNVLIQNPDSDLTSYLAGKPKLGQPEFTKVRIIDSKNNQDEEIVDIDEITVDSTDINVDIAEQTGRRTDFIISLPEIIVARQHIFNPMEFVGIGSINHLNSVIVVENEKREERNRDKTDIYFASINNSRWQRFVTRIFHRVELANSSHFYQEKDIQVFYKTSYRMYDGDGLATDVESLQRMYAEYIKFRRNSNIPVSVKMNIPQTDLFRLNINTPKSLNGQALMIEKIENVSGEPTQRVDFRTLRNYL